MVIFYLISEFHNEEMESMVESVPQKANLRLSKRRKPKPALLRDLQPPTKRRKRRPVYTPSKIIRVTYWRARLVCLCTSALFSEQQVTGLQFEMCQMCWSKSLYKHREIQEYEFPKMYKNIVTAWKDANEPNHKEHENHNLISYLIVVEMNLLERTKFLTSFEQLIFWITPSSKSTPFFRVWSGLGICLESSESLYPVCAIEKLFLSRTT